METIPPLKKGDTGGFAFDFICRERQNFLNELAFARATEDREHFCFDQLGFLCCLLFKMTLVPRHSVLSTEESQTPWMNSLVGSNQLVGREHGPMKFQL